MVESFISLDVIDKDELAASQVSVNASDLTAEIDGLLSSEKRVSVPKL